VTSSSSPIRLYMKLLPRTRSRSNSYSVRWGQHGSVLVAETTEPLCAGSRALVARGVHGPVELWDDERPYPRMRGDIDTCAKLTVRETSRRGPEFIRYRPLPGPKDARRGQRFANVKQSEPSGPQPRRPG